MKSVLLPIFMFFTFSIYSQSIADLDKKRGFKNFVLGDAISKYQGRLVYIGTGSTGEVLYKISNPTNDEKTVFFSTFSDVFLAFKSGKLQTISLKKHYPGNAYKPALEDLKNMISNLMSLFGAPNERIDNDSLIGEAWNGKEVMLICTNNYLGFEKGSESEILIVNYGDLLRKGF